MNHAQDASRAAQARELLEHPLIVESLAALETEVMETWKKTSLNGAGRDDRERLFLILKAAQKFKAHLTSHVETGKLLSLKQTPSERLRRVVGLE